MSHEPLGCCRCTIPFPSVGRFRVTYDVIEADPALLPGATALNPHFDLPHQISLYTAPLAPYEGDLCQCEYDYLTKSYPGRDLPWSWRFTVTPLTPNERPKRTREPAPKPPQDMPPRPAKRQPRKAQPMLRAVK